MEFAPILLATGLLLNGCYKSEAELNAIPRDIEVMVGDSTYINCSTSFEAEKVQWRHGNNYVYRNTSILEPYNGRFSVEINSSAGTNNLVIRSVQPSDAGQYECIEHEGFGDRRSAQLIVLDGDPVCKSNLHSSGVIGPNTCYIEPEKITLLCSITYHGNVFPILQWKASGVNNSIKDGLYNLTSNKFDATYTLTMKSTLDLNNSSFICQTTRTLKKNYSCSSDVVRILYVFDSQVTVNITMNDEVTCYANTSQPCSYKWKWLSDDDWITVSKNRTLKPNRVGRHRCEAKCSLGNKSCTVESMYADVHSTAVPSTDVPSTVVHSTDVPSTVYSTDVHSTDAHSTDVHSTVATSNRNLWALLVLFVLPAIVVIYCRWKHLLEQKQKKQRETAKEVEEMDELMEQTGVNNNAKLQNKLSPVLVQTVRTKASEEDHNMICGLAILDNELFVASQGRSKVEVYDSIKFSLSRRWNAEGLLCPVDIGSCNRNKCLYIFDYKVAVQWNEILRVDPNGKLLKKWSTGYEYGYNLSVTNESNVILTVYNKNKLNEYSPDGQLIREINLFFDAGNRYLLHALKMTNGHFVVSHGGDPLMVNVTDGDGKPKKLLEKSRWTTGRMDVSVHLGVDENGSVIVADQRNSRVLLLNSDLEFKREILSQAKHGIQQPVRILLDQTNGRLFVADNEMDNQRILIFDLNLSD